MFAGNVMQEFTGNTYVTGATDGIEGISIDPWFAPDKAWAD